MKKRIFAVAAALCLMAGTGAFAQEAKPAAAPKERPTVEQMAQRMTERMQKELKLTDAQAKEVYNLNFQQIKEMQAMREKMREARKAEAEKMKSILTTEQFVQWSQMQAPLRLLPRLALLPSWPRALPRLPRRLPTSWVCCPPTT